MKKLVALLTGLLIAANAWGATGSPTLWEKAAYGDIPGVTHVKILGWNGAITTTFEDVTPESSALAIPLVALTTPYCASTDADDDGNPEDTGARTLSVTVVNTSYAETTETVILNGTTSVALATANVLGINKVEVLTAGSTLGNEGVIDCGDGNNSSGSAANAYQTIGVYSATAVPAAGAGMANVSQGFRYIVPAGYTLLCRNIQVGSVFATAAAGVDVAIDGSTNAGLVKRFYSRMIHNTGANPSLDPGYIVFPEKTYLVGKAAGVTGSNTGPLSMSMDCLKISNTWKDTAQDIF